jgi:hypothetical protein
MNVRFSHEAILAEMCEKIPAKCLNDLVMYICEDFTLFAEEEMFGLWRG